MGALCKHFGWIAGEVAVYCDACSAEWHLPPLRLTAEARWQSGYAADCNSVYAGSIPTLASIFPSARVAELVDATDLKSVIRKGVRVQVPPRAPRPLQKKRPRFPAGVCSLSRAGLSLWPCASKYGIVAKTKLRPLNLAIRVAIETIFALAECHLFWCNFVIDRQVHVGINKLEGT